MQMIKADAYIGKRMARSERNEIVHRNWRATDTPEVKALVKVKHSEPEEHVAASQRKG
jgi:hypothetical protein